MERFTLNSVKPHWSLHHSSIPLFSQNKTVFEAVIVALASAKARLIKYMTIRLQLMKIWLTMQRDRET